MPLIILVVGLYLMWQRGTAAPHIMTPTAVAIALLLALLADASAFGPGRWPDKIAFLVGTPAIREGFDGSPLDQATTQRIHDWIQSGLESQAVAGSHLAQADVNKVIGAVVGVIWLYAVFCLLPSKLFSKRLGRVATLQFPASRQWRLNPTVWAVAIVLGLFADMPAGAVGIACRGSVDMLIGPIQAALAWAFGA